MTALPEPVEYSAEELAARGLREVEEEEARKQAAEYESPEAAAYLDEIVGEAEVEQAIAALEETPQVERLSEFERRNVLHHLAGLPPLKRDAYTRQLARLLGVPVATVRREVAALSPREEVGKDPHPDADVEAGRALAEELGNRVLDEAARTVHRLGVVGEERIVRLTYLALTSRLLGEPVSIAVKGASASGKSFSTQAVLRLFPEGSYIARTGLSPRALAYSEEDFSHRTIVIFEAEGLGEEGQGLLRSFLSEGRLVYETVDATPSGLKPRVITKPGPTNCVLTTTRVSLHPENETRLLTVTADDSPEQTRRVLAAMAEEREDVDLAAWRGLQAWLETQAREVVIPFASDLLGRIPPRDVRLRRDVKSLLSLIKAHALLHQAARDKDERGRVIAAIGDYAAVRELVADLISYQVGQAVRPSVRETVEAVRDLLADGREYVAAKDLQARLGLGHDATARRVREAIREGYVIDVSEGRQGKTRRLVLGDDLPGDDEILPRPEDVCTHPPGESVRKVGKCRSEGVLSFGNRSETVRKVESGMSEGSTTFRLSEDFPNQNMADMQDFPTFRIESAPHPPLHLHQNPFPASLAELYQRWTAELGVDEDDRCRSACFLASETWGSWFKIPEPAREYLAAARAAGLVTTQEAAERARELALVWGGGAA